MRKTFFSPHFVNEEESFIKASRRKNGYPPDIIGKLCRTQDHKPEWSRFEKSFP